MMDAQSLTLSLSGKWFGGYGVAPCPICQPERRRDQSALTLKDGQKRLLLTCRKVGCAFTDILLALGVGRGDYVPVSAEEVSRRKAEEARIAQRKADQARAIWQESIPIEGTIADAYLRGRGITCALPDSLRFHGKCWHGPTARFYPAMIAAVTCQNGTSSPAIHRTYLKPDGRGKADVAPAKMMLGKSLGGAVAVARGIGTVVVAEGIETALSLVGAPSAPEATVLASLSAPGLKGVVLPQSGHERLIVATDGDDAGREAGSALAMAAQICGWRVDMLCAPEGMDWNDIRGRSQ